jgi:hypothetical protein
MLSVSLRHKMSTLSGAFCICKKNISNNKKIYRVYLQIKVVTVIGYEGKSSTKKPVMCIVSKIDLERC